MIFGDSSLVKCIPFYLILSPPTRSTIPGAPRHVQVVEIEIERPANGQAATFGAGAKKQSIRFHGDGRWMLLWLWLLAIAVIYIYIFYSPSQ